MTNEVSISFKDLALPQPILDALDKIGYEKPSPIQAATIPLLLEGRDLIGQAQTGTGKTAAFALPMLAKIDDTLKEPQLLVLAPTRELAIQVAEAFQAYASFNRALRATSFTRWVLPWEIPQLLAPPSLVKCMTATKETYSWASLPRTP